MYYFFTRITHEKETVNQFFSAENSYYLQTHNTCFSAANFLFIYFAEDSICTWTQIGHDNSIYSARHLIL